MPKEVVTGERWSHIDGCHRMCCGICSCGYSRMEFTDEERKKVLGKFIELSSGIVPSLLAGPQKSIP